MEIALYQPDIAGNAGTIARLCACLDLKLVIIEPAGFLWDDSRLKRAGMDYLDIAAIRRSASWPKFLDETKGRRKLLLTTKSALPYFSFKFRPDDILLLGRESSGVPDDVHQSADIRLTIPMHENARSLNVALACAMVVGEAQRQVQGFPTSVT
jgi:tRNA (cytidine/uridine-2'-O-)-methyltransferase